MSSGLLNISGPIDKDDFVIEIEIFPYSDEEDKNHNNKKNDSGEHYKVGNITVKQNGISQPFTDMDVANTFLKQLFGTADMYRDAYLSGKIFDMPTYKQTIEKLFKSDKTQIVFKPTVFTGGKRRKRKSRRNSRSKKYQRRHNKRKTRKHI
jgi:hypothetical protein